MRAFPARQIGDGPATESLSSDRKTPKAAMRPLPPQLAMLSWLPAPDLNPPQGDNVMFMYQREEAPNLKGVTARR